MLLSRGARRLYRGSLIKIKRIMGEARAEGMVDTTQVEGKAKAMELDIKAEVIEVEGRVEDMVEAEAEAMEVKAIESRCTGAVARFRGLKYLYYV